MLALALFGLWCVQRNPHMGSALFEKCCKKGGPFAATTLAAWKFVANNPLCVLIVALCVVLPQYSSGAHHQSKVPKGETNVEVTGERDCRLFPGWYLQEGSKRTHSLLALTRMKTSCKMITWLSLHSESFVTIIYFEKIHSFFTSSSAVMCVTRYKNTPGWERLWDLNTDMDKTFDWNIVTLEQYSNNYITCVCSTCWLIAR